MKRAPGSVSLSRFFPLLWNAQRHRLASCLPPSGVSRVDLSEFGKGKIAPTGNFSWRSPPSKAVIEF